MRVKVKSTYPLTTLQHLDRAALDRRLITEHRSERRLARPYTLVDIRQQTQSVINNTLIKPAAPLKM